MGYLSLDGYETGLDDRTLAHIHVVIIHKLSNGLPASPRLSPPKSYIQRLGRVRAMSLRRYLIPPEQHRRGGRRIRIRGERATCSPRARTSPWCARHDVRRHSRGREKHDVAR